MASQDLPSNPYATKSPQRLSAPLKQAAGTVGAPPVYRPQPAATSVSRGGFAAAPPAYPPRLAGAPPAGPTVQRRTQGAPIPAQNSRIQISAPPIYRPAQSAYRLKAAAQTKPMPGFATQQRTPLPASLRSRLMRGPMPGIIQRAASDKAKLEKLFNDAMSQANFAEADQIEKLMSKLPGDSMPKTFGVSDEDACDLTYRNTQIRFTFEAGLRAKLTKLQTTVGGDLMCALGPNCYVQANSEIKVDADGKEVWTSKSGTVHRTAPPIDHYSPDWKDRLAELIKKNYDVQKFATEGKKLYNAAPLRIIHKTCNSKRNGGG